MEQVADEFWSRQRVGGLATGEGLIAAVADTTRSNADGTAEVVPTEKRLFVVEEEFSKVLAQAKRDGNILSQIVREAFDTGVLNVLTRGHPLQARDAHMSVVGHICPKRLAARPRPNSTCSQRLRQAGFLWFVVRSDKVMPTPAPIPAAVFAEFVPG